VRVFGEGSRRNALQSQAFLDRTNWGVFLLFLCAMAGLGLAMGWVSLPFLSQ
jgi:hypothetical protein